ncbi:hypothetical protein FOH10_04940 [Nocardia otitidiscaviarum]|uniref:Uncharacterized protein n=1 Tax=Nocardia otitidiscaviarum TaxID=1823 RepID=A0A516NH01_9NOCA|nr:hypothetical protein [Nocardia otitidiscaviarum]MCP9623502.1 hypothetical protein [Nocardia otitidiscaviarum]QDP78182.1 hypothetical protein FOH10_04940 [Nocardia otitidiscaviarum]
MDSGNGAGDELETERPPEAEAADAGVVPPPRVHEIVDTGWLGPRRAPRRGRPRLTTIVMSALWIGTLLLYLWLQRGG